MKNRIRNWQNRIRNSDRILMQQALNALEYHTAQTRPIANTDEVIKALRARLARPDLAQVGEVGLWGESKA